MTIVFRGGVYHHIECNVCGKQAPTFRELQAKNSHGLASEGWFIAGGNHRCPEHFTEPSEPRPPRYEEVRGVDRHEVADGHE